MREFTDGSAAIVRGALEAGCTFFAGYPITPASPILMQMLRELPKVGGVAIQAEDEIASIGMCIGATLAGARAMTASSGPGLSLYSENIGLAIIGEVPLVIVDVQRLGPATGGATTVGQGDVQFARWGTAGGYPVIVLAPSSVSECHAITRRAFDLAERFRCPVLILADKELNLTTNTVDIAGYEAPPVRARGVLPAGEAPYRYLPAGDVAPIGQFGGDALIRFTGSTHDERAFITKAPDKVAAMNEHLRAKIEDHAEEIELVVADLDAGATTLFISYGVTAGSMREAVRTLRAGGQRVSALTILSLWPLPERALRAAFEGVTHIVVAELNHGQYRREIERLARSAAVSGIHRVDGELIAPGQFEAAFASVEATA
ncbi:MAG TPA: pyruvate flavodoxin/ferredoxin oxidoreductase [Candidatus Krumholzibacteria bacterium]|nr:pyruvate flavodoxin/ferredoxin oxidoreductase [Candidatus Krumholzibacteria bacterium]